MLENKNAVIYGAGGAIGSAVARAFAREGARVFLTGRRLSTVNVVVERISGDFGTRSPIGRTAGSRARIAYVPIQNEPPYYPQSQRRRQTQQQIFESLETYQERDHPKPCYYHGLHVIEFPSMEQLKAWYNSPEYAPARDIARNSVNTGTSFRQM